MKKFIVSCVLALSFVGFFLASSITTHATETATSENSVFELPSIDSYQSVITPFATSPYSFWRTSDYLPASLSGDAPEGGTYLVYRQYYWGNDSAFYSGWRYH